MSTGAWKNQKWLRGIRESTRSEADQVCAPGSAVSERTAEIGSERMGSREKTVVDFQWADASVCSRPKSTNVIKRIGADFIHLMHKWHPFRLIKLRVHRRSALSIFFGRHHASSFTQRSTSNTIEWHLHLRRRLFGFLPRRDVPLLEVGSQCSAG